MKLIFKNGGSIRTCRVTKDTDEHFEITAVGVCHNFVKIENISRKDAEEMIKALKGLLSLN